MATCKECRGKGSLRCPHCKGTGKKYAGPARYDECKLCSGSGKRKCDVCNGRGTTETRAVPG